MTEWHGWRVISRVGDSSVEGALHVGPYPRTKRIAIYLQVGTIARSLGWFRNVEDAQTFLEWMDRLVNLTTEHLDN